MKAALILLIVAIGVVCLNALPVENDEHQRNIEEGGNGGAVAEEGDLGLSRQKRSSHRRHHQTSSSSSSEERQRRRHKGRTLHPPTQSPSGSGRSTGNAQQGRQFFAAMAPVPAAYPYGAPAPYGAAPVVYG